MSNRPDAHDHSVSGPRPSRPGCSEALTHRTPGELARLRVASRCLAQILIRSLDTQPSGEQDPPAGLAQPTDREPEAFRSATGE